MFGWLGERLLKWQRARLEGEIARLTAESRRLKEEVRAQYGGGPIPLTKAEIERLREARKGIPPERLKEIEGLDLDKDVIEVDDINAP